MLQSLELERRRRSNSTQSLLDGTVSGWQASLVAQRIKPAMWETWVGKIPWRRQQWQPTPVLFPGKYHGRRSLVG